MADLQIIPNPDYISWESITDLLHEAYAERKEEGLNFSAVNQPVRVTISRVGDGDCLVALLEEKLVGTVSFRMVDSRNDKHRKWYCDDLYCEFFQVAVHPEYKKHGIATRLMEKLDEIADQSGAGSYISSTAADAIWLGKWYQKLGNQKVGYCSYNSTNYYSVIRRKPLHGKKINPIYRVARYNIEKAIVHMTFKKTGEMKFLGRLACVLLGR